jgi:alkylation response protein AidB-like acyl-CoA dehydrogenase
MGNYLTDNEDIQFYLRKEIDWDALVQLLEPRLPAPDGPQSIPEAVETYQQILDLIGDFSANQIQPVAAELDRSGVHYQDGRVVSHKKMDELFGQIKEMGLHGLSLPRTLGGMNCPLLLNFIAQELIARADVSVMTHFGFHGAIAMALMQYSLEEGSASFDTDGRVVKTRFDHEIAEILTGQAWGSMDITEPGAGSDMAQLQTRAVLNEEGQWLISGQKIFITSGHGKYHVVIARSETDAEHVGLKGLSLFLVPMYEERADGSRQKFVQIDRLEEKIGHHASPTCSVLFDKSPGILIGKRGEGFKYMLMLMNNARLGVGFESIGICESAYRLAQAYASQRQSMGKTINQHELIADYLDEMEVDLLGLRALAMYGAFHEEVYQRLHQLDLAKIGDESARKKRKKRQEQAAFKARKAIPLLKYLAAEKAVEMSRRCMQIHGGVGYTKDYGAEKLLRDALVAPIYEGTSQIQALMVMKDTLGWVLKKPQDFIALRARANWTALTSTSALERRLATMQLQSYSTITYLLQKTFQSRLNDIREQPMLQWLHAFRKNWDPKKDFSFALLHAERLTLILVDVLISEILFEQSERYPERRSICERYIARAHLRVKHEKENIMNFGQDLLATIHMKKKDKKADVSQVRT